MKKSIVLLFFVFFFSLFASQVNGQESSGEHIRSFEAVISINKDGTVDVTEKITYDFDDLDRHGIYRDIPFVKTNKNGKKFRLDFSNISVTDKSGSSYQYKNTESDGVMQLKIGDPDRTVTGVHTYVISYKVAGALTYFSDHDELYWNVTGDDWTVPISSSTSQVELADMTAQDRSKIQAICYTGPAGSTEQNCNTEKIGRKISFNSELSLNSGEGITVAVSFPKNIVAVLEPKPYVTFWETILGKIVIAIITLGVLLWYVVYPIWIPIKWLKEGRDPKPINTGEARAWFDPPNTKSGRPLTPGEVGALVDERVDMPDIASTIVSLAQKGYLKIEKRAKGDFNLLKSKELAGDTSLLPYERNFFHKLFQNGNELSLKTRKTYLTTAVENIKKDIYEQLISNGFFPHNPDKIRTFYTIIGVLALTTGNIPLTFSAFFFGRNMPRKTHLGVESSNIAKSLRNFLVSQERQLKYQASKQMMFEKLLPFAIAFGVEKIWADRFKDIALKEPDWYHGYSSGTFNSLYLTNSLNSSFSSFSTAATPVSSSTGHSSGFSGGSSGGGGGGGGGGSW